MRLLQRFNWSIAESWFGTNDCKCLFYHQRQHSNPNSHCAPSWNKRVWKGVYGSRITCWISVHSRITLPLGVISRMTWLGDALTTVLSGCWTTKGKSYSWRIERFHKLVIKIKAKKNLESFAYSRPVFVGGMRYIKINEISTNLDRIERNTCDNYQKYRWEKVKFISARYIS